MRSSTSGSARRLTAILVMLAAGPLWTAAAAAQTAPPEAGPEAYDTAPLIIDGSLLFDLRGAIGLPAATRVAEIRDKILAFARDRSLDVDDIRIEDSDLGPRLTHGDGSVTLVVAVEAEARRTGLNQTELATAYRHRIRQAITAYRTDREPEVLVRRAGWALAATILLVVLLRLGGLLFRRLDRRLTGRIEDAVARLRIQSFRLLSANQTWHLLRALLRGTRALTLLGLVYVYLNFTLGLFPWTRGFALGMLDLVLSPLLTMGRAVVAWLPDLVFLIVLTLVTRLLLHLIHLFFRELESGAVRFEGFDGEWAMPTYRLVRVLVVAFALVVAFPYIPGSSSGAFKGVSLFIGVLFSLGSSSIIGNVIAGYTMTYRRAFKIGDRIRVGEVVGDVTEARLLVTHVRTPKNEDTVIPNSVILATNVVNYSALAREHGLILHTTVGIGYEVPWRQVEAMLLMAADRTSGLLAEPPPFVLQTGLGDFAITYEINAYCDQPKRMASLYSALHRSILDVFNEYGVAIMTPAYRADTPDPKMVPPERWYEAPAEPTADEL